MLVKDHLGKPVSNVPVVLAEQQSFRQGMEGQDFESPDRVSSDSNGIAVFICNTPAGVTKVVLKVRVWTCGPADLRTSRPSLSVPLIEPQSCCCIWSSRRQFVTADPNLPLASQAELPLTAVAYESPNQRYIYIDPPLPNRALQVGSYANIKVYSAMPSYVPISALSYMVREGRLTGLDVPIPAHSVSHGGQ